MNILITGIHGFGCLIILSKMVNNLQLNVYRPQPACRFNSRIYYLCSLVTQCDQRAHKELITMLLILNPTN